MTEVRLKYLHSFVDRHGHVRYYFRYRGNRWTLPVRMRKDLQPPMMRCLRRSGPIQSR